MKHPCPEFFPCPGTDFPFRNYSSEAPDHEIFIGINSGWGDYPPGLGGPWTSYNCQNICESSISQADADACAARDNVDCQSTGDAGDPGLGDGGGIGRVNQGGGPATVLNEEQHCDALCPDGSLFTAIVPAGRYHAPNLALANRIAMSFACKEAATMKFCLNNIPDVTCVLKDYSGKVSASGGVTPYTYALTSGALPDGMLFDPDTQIISGAATVAGFFHFTIEAHDSAGKVATRNYLIAVLGITNTKPLTPGSIGVLYTLQLTTDGTVPPVTFELFTGTLPTGLLLTSSGLIVGIPTAFQTKVFDVKITDDDGDTCTQELSLTINPAGSCPSAAGSIALPTTQAGRQITGCDVRNKVFATCRDSQVYVIDPTTNTITDTILIGEFGSRSMGILWVPPVALAPSITTVTAPFNVPAKLATQDVTVGTSVGFVANSMVTINGPATFLVVSILGPNQVRLKFAGLPGDVAPGTTIVATSAIHGSQPGSDMVYLTTERSNRLYSIDPNTHALTLLQSLVQDLSSTFTTVSNIAYSPASNRIFFAAEETLYSYRILTSVLDTVFTQPGQISDGIQGIVYCPFNGYFYVSNFFNPTRTIQPFHESTYAMGLPITDTTPQVCQMWSSVNNHLYVARATAGPVGAIFVYTVAPNPLLSSSVLVRTITLPDEGEGFTIDAVSGIWYDPRYGRILASRISEVRGYDPAGNDALICVIPINDTYMASGYYCDVTQRDFLLTNTSKVQVLT